MTESETVGDDLCNLGKRFAAIDRNADGLRLGALVAHSQEYQGVVENLRRRVEFGCKRDVVSALREYLDQLQRIGLDHFLAVGK
jgi:hypothetical protein